MPKNNNSKLKSARKPLSDISNGGKLSKSVKKKVVEHEAPVEDDVLDRLLLVHSDFSNLIHQLDELVVQAFKLKLTSKKGRKEIESFTHVLSDMHSSLKSWVPRFQKVLSSSPIEVENQLEQSLSSRAVPAVNEEISDVAGNPKEPEVDFLVSPSPLVSWRADCTIEKGRQLFLLTPLPRSGALSSKCRGFSRMTTGRNIDKDAPSNTNLGLPSLFTISGNTNDDLLEEVELKPTPNKFSNSTVAQAEGTLTCAFVSPPRLSNKGHSMFLMTPCLKMSPPKSCVLLEPISKSSLQENDSIPKSTPFPVEIENCIGTQTSESSSSQISESLMLKYPELFRPKLPHTREIGRKEVETSPAWFISPPKTCVLMEPPDKKLSINSAVNGNLSTTVFDEQSTQMISAKDQVVQGECPLIKRSCNQELQSVSLGFLESTPMWKDLENTTQAGKCPGENTLKRELWTKFEAASTNTLHFNMSSFPETARKGFLDRLEEVSCEETSSVDKGS